MLTANEKYTLGQKIKLRREACQLTQLGLAHDIGMLGPNAGAYISRIESDSQEPRLHTLRKIAEALGTTIEKLLTNS